MGNDIDRNTHKKTHKKKISYHIIDLFVQSISDRSSSVQDPTFQHTCLQ